MTPSHLIASAAALLALVEAPPSAANEAVEAEHGMVVAAQHYASEAGVRILQRGGNAVDAAVAVGYALAVVDPCCGNIGGGGFMVVRLADGRETFLDFRETAPNAARADMYLDGSGAPVAGLSLHGWLAAAVPGTVAGLDRVQGAYGHLSRAEIMAPAVALAREGFVLEPSDADLLNKTERLAQDPAAAAVFRRREGRPWAPGDKLVQSDLAETLALIARDGPDAFYRGPIAAAVAAASRAGGGILTTEDFAAYRAGEAAPLACSYRGYRLVSAPPPSSGGVTLCEILGVIDGRDMKALGHYSAPAVHVLVEAMRHAYLDRNTWLGDPAFVANPVDWLLSPAHVAQVRAAIEPDHASPSAALHAGTAPHERPETTHYSIVDRDGNAVAVTYTINGNFGAGIMAPGTGFLLNNEMDDFTIKPGTPNLFGLVQEAANAIAPGKRPLSSMAPTIVEKDGRPVFVLGSPGGSRIITAVLETIVNIVDYGMAPQAAVDAPRLHHQWLPDRVFYESDALAPDAIEALRRMGYDLAEQPSWGAVELIAIRPGGRLSGVNDRRRPAGAAMGY
jgi:gamma-glutamyltranspeptidase/glutathione hydrolase